VIRIETTFAWQEGEVSGVWHRPAEGASTGLVLGHGAGHGMQARLLIDVADALAGRGIAVLRFNFPYAEEGRKAPDPQARLEACSWGVAKEAAAVVERLWLGGKSLGGRIASHIVADGFPAAGLVFLGYPLHPPGKPEKIRDVHLRRIAVPMLFLQGTRDPFAKPELLRSTLAKLPSARLVEIAGGDHSFKVSGRPPADVTREVVEAIAGFLA
jgi:hypothetical protein